MLGSKRVVAAIAAAAALTGCSSGSGSSSYHPPPRQAPILDDSISPESCSGWLRGALLATCDPELLVSAYDNHQLTTPGKLDVTISGRKVRVGGNPALTQVIPADGRGEALVPGSHATLTGKLSAGSYLYFRAQSVTPHYVAFGEALFRGLGLEHGGTATIDVRLRDGKLLYDVRRGNGSKARPLRTTLQAGPGPAGRLPTLPDGEADTPEQAVHTYAAAINAHDGKTICQLLTFQARAAFRFGLTPCWQLVSGHIGYGEESSTPLFEQLALTHVGHRLVRKNYGVSFTGIPIDVRLRYSNTSVTERSVFPLHDVVWFQQTEEGWRMGKASRTLYAAFSGNAPPDVLAPPDPLAALHKRQAEERKNRAVMLANRRSLMRPAARLLGCAGKKTTVRDRAGDVRIATIQKARRAARDRALIGGADFHSFTVVVSGKVACAIMTFGHRPLRGRIGLSLYFSKRGQQPLGGDGVYVDFARDGIHAGRQSASLAALDPTGVRLGLVGRTLSIRLQLSSRLPSIRESQLRDLKWHVSASGEPDAHTFQFWDELPSTLRGQFWIRQSDGRIVKLY